MKGVITIAGHGTRFLPASKSVPKEIFPIAGIPLIQHHVESLVASGIEEIIVVVRENYEVVQRHFAPAPDLEQYLAKRGKQDLLDEVQRLSKIADIVFVRQSEKLPYGNASPALAARPWLDSNQPFYYLFGDDIIVSDVPVPRQMVDAFNKYQPAGILATQLVPDEETHLYACIQLKDNSPNEIAHIVEKPAPGTAPSNQVQTGHFIFTPELFEVLSGSDNERGKNNELWIADAVGRLITRSTVVAQPIEGQWMAAGDPLRHLKACIEVTLRRDDMRDDLIDYLRSLDV